MYMSEKLYFIDNQLKCPTLPGEFLLHLKTKFEEKKSKFEKKKKTKFERKIIFISAYFTPGLRSKYFR